MRRNIEQLFLLIERTVPVLLAIGAVLSVLSVLFPTKTGLLIVCLVAWSLALAAAVSEFVFFLISGKKSKLQKKKNAQVSPERDRLSEVAHELKTPLTVIRGSVEVLADGAVSSEQYPEYFARILRETDAMTRLVSDLLESTRKTKDIRFEPEPTDLPQIAQSVLEDLKQTAAESEVELAFSSNARIPMLMLDPHRVAQVMIILLDNAIKHSPKGGKVTLSLFRDSSGVVLSVQGQGKGIDPRDLPHLFERYYKAPPSRGGRSDGSGIGLCVAKQIAELHGGSIQVKSKKGKGALFTVRFPLSKCKVK